MPKKNYSGNGTCKYYKRTLHYLEDQRKLKAKKIGKIFFFCDGWKLQFMADIHVPYFKNGHYQPNLLAVTSAKRVFLFTVVWINFLLLIVCCFYGLRKKPRT